MIAANKKTKGIPQPYKLYIWNILVSLILGFLNLNIKIYNFDLIPIQSKKKKSKYSRNGSPNVNRNDVHPKENT